MNDCLISILKIHQNRIPQEYSPGLDCASSSMRDVPSPSASTRELRTTCKTNHASQSCSCAWCKCTFRVLFCRSDMDDPSHGERRVPGGGRTLRVRHEVLIVRHEVLRVRHEVLRVRHEVLCRRLATSCPDRRSSCRTLTTSCPDLRSSNRRPKTCIPTLEARVAGSKPRVPAQPQI